METESDCRGREVEDGVGPSLNDVATDKFVQKAESYHCFQACRLSVWSESQTNQNECLDFAFGFHGSMLAWDSWSATRSLAAQKQNLILLKLSGMWKSCAKYHRSAKTHQLPGPGVSLIKARFSCSYISGPTSASCHRYDKTDTKNWMGG